MSTTTTAGERIRIAREYKRLTPAQLAAKVPCSERSVQGWESDSAKPKYEQIAGLAKALGVSADYIIGLQTIGKRGRS